MNFVNYQAKAVKTSKHYFIWTSEHIPPHNCNIPAAQISYGLLSIYPLINTNIIVFSFWERASGPVVGLEAATLLLRSSTPGSHKKNPLAVSPFEDVPACGNGAAQPGGCGSGRRPRLRCRPWVRPGFGGFLGLASRVLLCMTIPLGRSFPSRPSFFACIYIV